MIYRNSFHSNNKNQMYHIGHTDNIFCPNGETLSIRLESIKSDITNHATRLNTLDTRCTNIESKNTEQDNILANLENRATKIESKNSSQDTEISNLKTRMTNAENKNTEQDQRLNALINLLYPVDSIKITYNNKNPGTYLPGTTWQLISAGRYIRGASSTDTGGAIGGASTVHLAHTHSIPEHRHTINHTHTIPAHNHTVNAHRNHTLTLNEIPAHMGHVQPHSTSISDGAEKRGGYIFSAHAFGNGNGGWRTGNNDACAFDVYYGNEIMPRNHSLGGGGAHNHGNTGNSSPGTNSKSLTTNSGGGNSGFASLETNSSLSIISINPPYTILYIWRRTR